MMYGAWKGKYNPMRVVRYFGHSLRLVQVKFGRIGRKSRAQYLMVHTAQKVAQLYDREAWLTYNGARNINLCAKLNSASAMRYHGVHRKPLLP